jgi:hypothetical protein
MSDKEYQVYKKEVANPDLDKLIKVQLSYDDVSEQLMNKINELLENYK